MDPTVVFSEFQVLLFHLWGLKKKDRRKNRYEGRGRSRTRRKEREGKGVKRKKNSKNIIIKNYLKKKKKTSLLAKPVLLVFFGCSQLRQPSPALLHPI